MDPYQTLGLSKGCTRDELKEAFRARAQLAHPDRGGDPAAFIRLRQAFDQISDDLVRRPPAPAAEIRDRPKGQSRRPSVPDPDWEPDLIVRDEPLPRRRPARPHDPNWKPDLIVVDEPARPVPVSASADSELIAQNYIGWLRQGPVGRSDKDRAVPASRRNVTPVLAIVIAIVLTFWICWAAWRSAPATAGSEASIETIP